MARGLSGGRSGSVVQVQRFDSSLRLDVHYHGLFLDGVYTGFDSGRALTFHPANDLTDDEVVSLVRHIKVLIFGYLRRRGYVDDQAVLLDESEGELDELSIHQAAAVQGLIRILEDAGVRIVQIAFQAPNMNAIAERWVLSIKSECLGRMILFGQEHLERVLRQYVAHFHGERPHQGLGNELIDGDRSTGDGDVITHERLGGLLKSYCRSAA